MSPVEFRKAPFLKLLFPLIAGIFLGRQDPASGIQEWIPILISSCLLLASVFLKRNGYLSLAAILFLGISLGISPPPPQYGEMIFTARVGEVPVRSGKARRILIDRIQVYGWDSTGRYPNLSPVENPAGFPVKAKAYAYLAGESFRAGRLMPGDFIIARGRILPYEPPRNPCQFDYGKYLEGKGIFYHVYLDSTSWQLSGQEHSPGIRIRAILARQELIRRLEKGLPERGGSKAVSRNQLDILKALLLGYREGMDRELKEGFARSGTMHVLAVSGLHVGILYLFPALLLRRLKYRMCAAIPLYLVLATGLWGYAFLTGLSSSVTRAVTMCCIHGIAMLVKRRVSGLHVLSLTAFLMIIARPPSVFEAGFQLSFIAVSGIILVFPCVYRLIRLPGRAGRRITQMLALSVTAQLSTLPLSILYFNRATPLSFVGALVVIPVVSIILYAGFLYFLLPAGLSGIFAGILRQSSYILEWFTANLAEVPGACVEGLSLLPQQVLLLYIAGILYLSYLGKKKPVSLFSFLIVLTAFAGISIFREHSLNSHSGFYVFHVPGRTALAVVEGRNCYLYGDNIVHNTPYELGKFLMHYKLEKATIRHTAVISPAMEADLFNYRGMRIMVLRKWDRRYASKLPDLELDILLLSNNIRVSADDLSSQLSVKQILTDGSSSFGYSRKIERECQSKRICYHSTRLNGYFSMGK